MLWNVILEHGFVQNIRIVSRCTSIKCLHKRFIPCLDSCYTQRLSSLSWIWWFLSVLIILFLIESPSEIRNRLFGIVCLCIRLYLWLSSSWLWTIILIKSSISYLIAIELLIHVIILVNCSNIISVYLKRVHIALRCFIIILEHVNCFHLSNYLWLIHINNTLILKLNRLRNVYLWVVKQRLVLNVVILIKGLILINIPWIYLNRNLRLINYLCWIALSPVH